MIWLSIVLVPIIVALVGFMLRPSYIHRGLTHQEWTSQWAGDHLVEGASPSGSRAIVIQAPAHEVWSWITQIGQDRAGFYSYRWLENLVGAQMPSVNEKRPEWSTREVGQKLIMAPPKRFGKMAAMDIVEAVDGQYFVAKNFEGTWAFIIEPIDETSCRFVARGMWLPSANPIVRIAHAAIFDPIHYFMEWKMIREVKIIAETAFKKNIRDIPHSSQV